MEDSVKKYRTLKSIFHEHDEATARAEYERRKARGYRPAMKLGEHELFYVPTQETSLLLEKIYMNEREIDKFIRSFRNEIVYGYMYGYVRDLIADEVAASNNIEGIEVARQETIYTIKDKIKWSNEMLNLYESLLKNFMGEKEIKISKTPEDLRALYDEFMEGELSDDDRLDGELFRKGPVFIKDGGGKTIYAGVSGEDIIAENLKNMFFHMEDKKIPQLFSIVIGHFILEATHPFYDGNGRLGRFLLSAQLLPLLSPPTVFTLSRKIYEKKSKYYKAFSIVEEPYNYADATSFLIEMLEIIFDTQEDLIKDFKKKERQLNHLRGQIEALREKNKTMRPTIKNGLSDSLDALGHLEIFRKEKSATLAEMSHYIGQPKRKAYRYVRKLEKLGIVTRLSSNPLRIEFSIEGRKRFILDLPKKNT